jgi:hypothetical protein
MRIATEKRRRTDNSRQSWIQHNDLTLPLAARCSPFGNGLRADVLAMTYYPAGL